MTATPSNMIPLGTKAPDFQLYNVTTKQQESLENLKSDIATVVMFLCNHCPFVKYIQPKLVEITQQYQAKGISFVAISANDASTYPQDGPDEMRKEAERWDYSFPYLYDESQEIAKAYQAACTPDFFIYDKNLACVYRGRFDNATPGNHLPATGQDLKEALDNILSGKPVDSDQKASIGCNIKWKR